MTWFQVNRRILTHMAKHKTIKAPIRQQFVTNNFSKDTHKYASMFIGTLLLVQRYGGGGFPCTHTMYPDLHPFNNGHK